MTGCGWVDDDDDLCIQDLQAWARFGTSDVTFPDGKLQQEPKVNLPTMINTNPILTMFPGPLDSSSQLKGTDIVEWILICFKF